MTAQEIFSVPNVDDHVIEILRSVPCGIPELGIVKLNKEGPCGKGELLSMRETARATASLDFDCKFRPTLQRSGQREATGNYPTFGGGVRMGVHIPTYKPIRRSFDDDDVSKNAA